MGQRENQKERAAQLSAEELAGETEKQRGKTIGGRLERERERWNGRKIDRENS